MILRSHRTTSGIMLALAGMLLAALPLRQVLCEEGGQPCEYAFVVTSDYYSAGYYSTVEIPPPRQTTISIGPVAADAVAYYDWSEETVFVANRYLADNVQIVGSVPPFATIGQYSVGNGSNPHDIRLADGAKAYVSRFEWKTLLIVNPYSGDSLGTVDLTAFADGDGIPDMDRMETVGNRLFVSLNNIERTAWTPAGPGKIAVIDMEADTLVDCDPDSAGVQPIVLELPNPYTELRYDACEQELYVGCAGTWGVMDGGVEAIDPQGLRSDGVVLTEQDLGGDIFDVEIDSEGKGFGVVFDAAPWPGNYARLVEFDRVTGAVTDTLFMQTSGSGSSLAGIELNRQMELYLSDRNLTHPGVRIYDIATGTQVAFIDVGLPPFDITFTQKPMASVTRGRHPIAHDRSLTSRPNPFITSTTITWAPPSGAEFPASLVIFDALGRNIRRLAGAPCPAGACGAEWDGKDEAGSRVAPGAYFCRVQGGQCSAAGKIILLR